MSHFRFNSLNSTQRSTSPFQYHRKKKILSQKAVSTNSCDVACCLLPLCCSWCDTCPWDEVCTQERRDLNHHCIFISLSACRRLKPNKKHNSSWQTYAASDFSNRAWVEEILEHLQAALLFRQKAQSMAAYMLTVIFWKLEKHMLQQLLHYDFPPWTLLRAFS